LLPFFRNYKKKSVSKRPLFYFISDNLHLRKGLYILFILSPLYSIAQQADTVKLKDTVNNSANTDQKKTKQAQSFTRVNGKVTDAATGLPLSLINISFNESHYGTSTDKDGHFF